MKTRQITIVGAILVVVLAVVGNNILAEKKESQPREEKGSNAKNVFVFVASPDSIQTTIPVTGKLVAADKIALYAEVQGIVQKQGTEFEEGNRFSSGQTLISIDANEFRLNLLSQKSTLLNLFTQLLPDIKIDFPESYQNWLKYVNDYDVEQPLPSLPEIKNEKEKYFLASRNIYTQYYNIKSLEEKLSKYSITAPFNGVVTEANIDAGTSISPGQKLGEFINPDNYELEAAVNLRDVGFITQGETVRLTSPDISGTWTGTVKRISDKIDPATQTVRVFISVSGKGLKEGMYLNGGIYSEMVTDAIEIDRKLLVNDSTVYIVQDTSLHVLPVELVKFGTGTAILKGVPAGTRLVNDNIVGAYVGMPVRVVDTVNSK